MHSLGPVLIYNKQLRRLMLQCQFPVEGMQRESPVMTGMFGQVAVSKGQLGT